MHTPQRNQVKICLNKYCMLARWFEICLLEMTAKGQKKPKPDQFS